MNKSRLFAASLLALAGAGAAQAHMVDFSIMTTWYEPDTQPKNSIFTGSFTFDMDTLQVMNLTGGLTESMTGVFPMAVDAPNAPYYDQTILNLTYQMNDWVPSYGGPADAPPSTNWHQDDMAGTFATVFLKNTTDTYSTLLGGNGWSPQSGVTNSGLYHNFPSPYAASIQNAYALIFVPDVIANFNVGDSVTLNWNEGTQTGDLPLAYTSYADCAPGGMMGATCMSSWSMASYGSVGTMSGYPLTQTITATAPHPVPEPESYAMLLAGLGLMGAFVRRRSIRPA